MNQKELLFISITIFFTIIAWIVADLNHIANTRKVETTNQAVTKKIKVNVDKEIFVILNNKR